MAAIGTICRIEEFSAKTSILIRNYSTKHYQSKLYSNLCVIFPFHLNRTTISYSLYSISQPEMKILIKSCLCYVQRLEVLNS